MYHIPSSLAMVLHSNRPAERILLGFVHDKCDQNSMLPCKSLADIQCSLFPWAG